MAHAAGVETIEDLMTRFEVKRARIVDAFRREGAELPPSRRASVDPATVAPMLEGRTMGQVAAELGVSRRQVLAAAAKAGVRKPRGRPGEVDPEVLAALVAEGLSWAEIGRRLGCAGTTASRTWERLRSSGSSAGSSTCPSASS